MPDDLFSKHHNDKIPLHRNTMPVAECDVHTTTTGGKTCKAIDVPILSCAGVWLRVQKEAEAWIAPGGKLIEDKQQRNRQINRAYAQLWQADRRFQWAGLAAFASKQVGCGLLHAAQNIKSSREEIDANNRRTDIMNSSDGASISVMPNGIGAGAAYMYDQLALGNTALFLDIYPLHRFYMLRGVKHMRECLKQRAKIIDHVIWPVDKKLPFGRAFGEILQAFEMIERNEIAKSVERLAYHEQINILQATIYDDAAMRRALDTNQFSWATGFPTGVAAEIELTLSAECRAKSAALNVLFSQKKSAKLYDKDQRMAFVNEAASRFSTLLNGSMRATIEASINDIAESGGGR